MGNRSPCSQLYSRGLKIETCDNELSHFFKVMLCLIGEAFGGHGHLVNGAVVSVRNKGDKIGVWMGGDVAGRQDAVMAVGRAIKERLCIDAKTSVGFEAHQDMMKKSGSTAKNRFVV